MAIGIRSDLDHYSFNVGRFSCHISFKGCLICKFQGFPYRKILRKLAVHSTQGRPFNPNLNTQLAVSPSRPSQSLQSSPRHPLSLFWSHDVRVGLPLLISSLLLLSILPAILAGLFFSYVNSARSRILTHWLWSWSFGAAHGACCSAVAGPFFDGCCAHGASGSVVGLHIFDIWFCLW